MDTIGSDSFLRSGVRHQKVNNPFDQVRLLHLPLYCSDDFFEAIMRFFKKEQKPEPKSFTGTCLVKQHTGDGHFVGRCYHSTYDGVCHVHGNISQWLDGKYRDWPRDYELASC